MRRFFLLLFLAAGAQAQPWSGILPSSRAIDWSTAGLPATFPDGETTPSPWTPPARTQCGATLTPLGGGLDDSPQIGSALSACSAASATSSTKGYVLLGSGTFAINSLLAMYNLNNVSLRGGGPMQTTLSVNGGSTFILMGGAAGGTGSGTLTATSYAKGTTSITVGSISGTAPAANLVATIAQCDTGSGGNLSACTTPADNGSLFVCGDTTNCAVNSRGSTFAHQAQTVFITAVVNNGNGTYTLTLNHGLYMPNWSSASGATISWRLPTDQGVGLGLEDMTISSNTSTVSAGLVNISNAYASWITGVRFIGQATGGHGDTYVVSSDNILFGHNYLVPGYYSLSLTTNILAFHISSSSDVLALNNIVTMGAAAEYNGQNSGVVTAFNLNRDGWTTGVGCHWSFDHAGSSSFDLWEGNITCGMTEDDLFGTHDLNTYFRNNAPCYDPPYLATAAGNYSIIIDNYQRFDNVIGNAMGGPSAACNIYQGSAASGAMVYIVSTADSLAGSTLTRWGNVTTVTQSTDTPANSGKRFVASEVPSGLSGINAAYAVPVPGSTTLPASFFLKNMTAHPNGGTGLGWWKVCTSWTTFPTACAASSTPAFPIAGPDVTGGYAIMNGFGGDNPASVAWANLPVDTTLQNSYTITSSSWSAGTETLTVSGLPGPPMGPFQLSGVAAGCSTGATFNAANEILITASNGTTISYALTSNPGVSCAGTLKWPDVRQFDERVYQSDGAASIGLSPTSLNFGNQSQGTTSPPQTITATNNGSTAVTGLNTTGISIIGSGQGSFAQTNNCPASLGSGASCAVQVTFTPAAVGPLNANIQFTYGGGTGSPQSASLSGTGTTGGRTFYVSTTGSDSNTCAQAQLTSGSPPVPTNPKLTASQGIGCASNPGDTVVFANGTYGNEGVVDNGDGFGSFFVVNLAASGSSNAPITIMAQNRGGAILDGGNTATGSATQCTGADSFINFGNVSFVTVDGFVLQRNCASGFQANGAAHDITISHNEIKQIGIYSPPTTNGGLCFGIDGIFVNSNESNFTFDSNWFHNIGRVTAPAGCTHAHDQGLYLYGSGHKVINNIVSDLSGGWCMQLSPGNSNITVDNNTFINCTPVPGVSSPGMIQIWGAATNLSFTNNLFYLTSPATAAFSSYQASPLTNVTADHNVVFGNATALTDGSFSFTSATNTITTNPNLVSTAVPVSAATNLQVTTGSSAIDAGMTLAAVTHDYLGVTRPQGAAYDIGAFEFTGGGGGSPQILLTPSSLTFTSQLVGTTSAAQLYTISNPGGANLTITALSIGGDFAFAGTGTCSLPQTLTPSASCTVSINFTPTAAGARSATVTATSNAASGGNVESLTGTGVNAGTPTTSYAPTSLAFGTQNINTTSGALTIILTNTGNASLNVSGIALVTGTNFALTTTPSACATGCTVAPNGTVTISVTFTPTVATGLSDTVKVISNAASSPDLLTVSGTGFDPSAIQIVQSAFCRGLSWPGTCAFSNPVTGGHLWLIAFGTFNNAGTSGVISSISNDKSDSYVQVSGVRSINTLSGSGSWNDLWYAAGIAAGGKTATVTPNSTVTGDVYMLEIANVNAVDVAGQVSSQAASLSPVGPSLTTTATQGIVVAFLHPDPAGQPNAVLAPWTLDVGGGMSIAHLVTSSAGTYQPQWSNQASASYAASEVALKQSAGGSPIVSLSTISLSYGGLQNIQTKSSALTVQLTNLGNVNLAISSIGTTGGNSGDFVISSNTCGGTLAPAASCNVTVQFNPLAVGTRSSSLRFTTNAASSPNDVTLTGTAILQPTGFDGAIRRQ